jgi:putative transposase
MAESGQPPLPAPAWQAITQTTQSSDSQWQVSDRRYLSEGSMALLAQPSKEVVAPAQLRPA